MFFFVLLLLLVFCLFGNAQKRNVLNGKIRNLKNMEFVICFFLFVSIGSKLEKRVWNKKNVCKKEYFFLFNLSSSSATTGRLDVGLKTKKNFEFDFINALAMYCVGIFFCCCLAKKNKNSVV